VSSCRSSGRDLRRSTSWYRALFDRRLVAEYVEVVVVGALDLAPAAVVLLVEQRAAQGPAADHPALPVGRSRVRLYRLYGLAAAAR